MRCFLVGFGGDFGRFFAQCLAQCASCWLVASVPPRVEKTEKEIALGVLSNRLQAGGTDVAASVAVWNATSKWGLLSVDSRMLQKQLQ